MKEADAKKEILDFSRTWKDLKELVDKADKNGLSKINPAFTKIQISQIFYGFIEGKDENAIPETMMFDVHTDRIKVSGTGLGVRNILREFG